MLRYSLLRKMLFLQLATFVAVPVMSIGGFDYSSTAHASPKSKASLNKLKKKRKIARKKKKRLKKKMRSKSAYLRASIKKFAGNWWIESLCSLALLFLVSRFLRLRRTERFDTLPAKKGFRVPSYFPRSKVKEESLHVWTDH